MRNINYFLVILILLLIIIFYIKRKPPEKNITSIEKDVPSTEKKVEPSEKISISSLKISQLNEDAILEMNEPNEYGLVSPGKISFSYEVINFRLAEVPKNQNDYNFALYSPGTHITLALNNKIHYANVSPNFEYKLDPGHYVAISFLTNMNYVSVKTPEAFVLRQFTVGSKPGTDLDLSGPNVFYNRPSGSYSGDHVKNLLLDFYLVNCSLSPKGFKIKLTINKDTFMIDDWSPYIIHGLPLGESIITLELLDKNGAPVKSPFQKVSQKVMLYEREPA